MKRFFNIIPSDQKCCILLYGEIGDWGKVTSGDITRELMEAEAMYNKIDVRINSCGGEVYAGIAIFNALRNSKADITIYIDGIAASMASVIALCGKPVHMSKYARLMLHNVSGGVYGNKDEINSYLKEIESLEDIISDMYASRLGKSKEEIKSTYFDGADHWIKAQEALSMGLIDGIYDTDPVAEDASVEDIYKTFNNRLNLEPPKNQTEMDLKEVQKRKRFKACASDEDVLKEIDALETENTNLQSENDTFRAAETAREAAEVTALLDAAEKDGRINATTRPTFEALLNADRTNGETALGSLVAKRSAMADIDNNGGGNSNPMASWDEKMQEIAKKTNQ